jgi:hypothetical protein
MRRDHMEKKGPTREGNAAKIPRQRQGPVFFEFADYSLPYPYRRQQGDILDASVRDATAQSALATLARITVAV